MESPTRDAASTTTGSQSISAQAPGATSPPHIHGYEIIGVLGEGGMGVVYHARQIGLGRQVALKMMQEDLQASDEQLARFRHEAQSVARLKHPHIVQIYEVGKSHGRLYYSFEYVEGGNLVRHYRSTRPNHRDAAKIVRTLAAAVHYAHQYGIIHRDLKPSNILVAPRTTAEPGSTPSGLMSRLHASGSAIDAGADIIVKVSDFGLAKDIGDDSGQTMTEQMVGTPSFMAPEQAPGRAYPIGVAADVYGLGGILYWLLTGQPPFHGKTALETIEQVRTQDPTPPSRIAADLPPDLETICLKCLRKEPSRRYRSAQEVADDLDRFLKGEPILGRPVRTWERFLSWRRRNRLVAHLAEAVAASILLGLVVSWSVTVWALRERSRADSETKHAECEAELGRRREYVLGILLAQQDWEKAKIGAVTERLAHLGPQRPNDPDYRDFEWFWLRRCCQLELSTLKAHQRSANALAISPDGRLLASGGDDRTVRIWNLATGQEQCRLEGHTAPVRHIAFSSSGEWLASSAGGPEPGEVKIWQTATGRLLRTLTGHRGYTWSMAFRPDGRELAIGSGGIAAGKFVQAQLRVCDMADWTVRELHIKQASVGGIAYSPDGRRMAAGCRDQTVRILDSQTGAELQCLRGHRGSVLCVSFSPDGRLLASGSMDRTVIVWDMTSARPLVTLIGHANGVWGMAFSPDHRKLASASDDCRIRVWSIDTGREILVLRGHRDGIRAIAYCPDGRRIASAGADGDIKIWDACEDQKSIRIGGHRAAVRQVAYSPDGLRIASAAQDGMVMVHDASTHRLLLSLRDGPTDLLQLAYSPDSRRLAAAGDDGIIRIWDALSGGKAIHLQDGVERASCVSFSSDGHWLAVGREDGSIICRDMAGRNDDRKLLGHAGRVLHVCFSPDGRHLVSTGSDQSLILWDVISGKKEVETRGQMKSDDLGPVALSPDGKLLATGLCDGGDDHTIKILNSQTFKEIVRLDGHSQCVRTLSWSPNGRRLVSTAMDHSARIWDTATWQQVLQLTDEADFLDAKFSLDGLDLAAAVNDGSVLIWPGRPLTPDSIAQREAASVVRFLEKSGFQRGELRNRINADKTISETVRRLALQLTDSAIAIP
jgi:WD40 repeat protein/serine/threonine protein kinase